MIWSLIPMAIACGAAPLRDDRAAAGIAIDPDHGVAMNGWAHMAWGSFLFMLFVGAPTPFRPTYCFLDRLCIHQTDPELKRLQIDSWSPHPLAPHGRHIFLLVYTRLWCLFEPRQGASALALDDGSTTTATTLSYTCGEPSQNWRAQRCQQSRLARGELEVRGREGFCFFPCGFLVCPRTLCQFGGSR